MRGHRKLCEVALAGRTAHLGRPAKMPRMTGPRCADSDLAAGLVRTAHLGRPVRKPRVTGLICADSDLAAGLVARSRS